ncbi:uncharacterized protein LOC112503341 [Cynara cardunculus var. scolymus]|uniref:UBA-like protein n=1 Tax=Cynara cardunculus var. scolymus TaxID=59895 RepID=A0A103XBD8_CYNCS|nr:uncharacterized protein LOC112503341 [Cynara cardunculus var. scolymus]XP_024963168.1 uncharacterized protein LOC112503341 [Cynara cardunculus var. scolymus]KVH87599.1 UBA-like protein [Cynara cardunculus var. scolymus]
MSPASRSKAKDKRATGKEPQKSSTKPTSNANAGGGVPASGYNPLLGTFHTLETAPVSSAPPIHVNGRSRNIDDTEDHIGNSLGMGVEYDSLSNNGSWSGESEDHKDKTFQGPSRQETVPGVDSDKREKIRQKNEKKHQRQKERRAQELHERCSGYLMSRKLEALAQQLVAMGFSSERATMALILNEGRVEQSVAWLFEGGEDADNQREHNLDSGGNLKLDISEELAQITEMEMMFKCSKQEVERVIVACEGDLQQAAETLKAQKQELPAAPPKLEETGDSSSGGGGKLSVAMSQNLMTSRTQSKSVGSIPIQQKTDDKDFNYTKVAVTVGQSSAEPGVKSLQLLKKIPPNSEWSKQQQVGTPSVEKRWAVGGSNPSVSYSLASPLQAAPPPAKTESRYATVGTELKNLQLGSVREPVIVMQRPKSKHIPASVSSSSSSVSVADWHPNVVEPVMNMNPNGYSLVHTSTRSFSTPSYGGNTQLYDQFHYQQQQQPLQQQQYASISDPLDHHFSQHGAAMNHFNNGGMWNRMVGATTTPTLAAASSLGLFSGLGSNGSSGPSSPVDWNAGDSLQFDYTNIDWSLDRVPGQANGSRPIGMWMGGGASDVYAAAAARGGKSAMRPPTGIVANGGLLHPDGPEASAGGEWSSPFEEKELFSFPRQFVSSPSL